MPVVKRAMGFPNSRRSTCCAVPHPHKLSPAKSPSANPIDMPTNRRTVFHGSRMFWRDLHAVTGFWVSGLAMVLLLTGLPWADVWGSAFKAVRGEMGWTKGAQDWTIGGRPVDANEHAEHDHSAMMAGGAPMPMGAHVMPDGSVMTISPVSLGEIVARAKSEHLPFPVIVTPPGKSPTWSVRSDTQEGSFPRNLRRQARH
jgi:uncharacterized iron-regulated membrane protein